jgi:Ran GTPase-activating protein (RanGAP) involved in mRNA processing and transport
VLTSPTFAKLETVNFSGAALTAKAFEVAPSATRLRDVDLHNSLIGDAGAAALAKAPQFSKVGVLRLRACEIGAKGIAAMEHSPLAAGIRELDIADNPLRSSGIEEFSRGRWPELHTLSLASCGIGADTVKSLQTADGLGKLIELDLSGNEVGAAGAIAASRAKWSGQLVRLNLARCRCAAGAVLANSDRFKHLQYLDLTDNPLNTPGIEALMASEWPELTDLRLSATLAGDEGVKILARSEAFARLVTLSLNRCGLTPAGLAALLAGRGSAAPASRLAQLDLSHNTELGDETTNILTRAALPALRFLSIAGIGLTPEGLLRLVGTPLLTRLSRLDFHANELLETEPPLELPEELREIERRPLPPDLEAAGLPIKST